MIDGKLVWLQEEDPNEDISIALIIWEQSSTSVLFKDILEAISLILHYRTTCWLDLEYSLTFTMWEAHSIFTTLSAMDWYLEVKIWAEDKQCSSYLLIQEIESHRDPEYIDFSVPRLARYLHRAWKRHQDAVFWVDIDLGIKEGLVFYQTRSNAIILQGTLPAHCIVKVERLKTGEKLYERQYLSPRPPPKISLKHDLNWTKGNDQGSTVEQQPVGKLVQQSLGEALQPGSSKPTQFPKPIEDRTGKPVTQEIVGSRKENLVLQIERGNLWKMKKNASWKITMERGNLWKEARTKCKKLVISKIVMTRTSSTLRWMTETSTSTSPVFQMRWWNDRKALTFITWFSKSKIILNEKHFRMISNSIVRVIPSAKSQKMRLWLLGILNYAR